MTTFCQRHSSFQVIAKHGKKGLKHLSDDASPHSPTDRGDKFKPQVMSIRYRLVPKVRGKPFENDLVALYIMSSMRPGRSLMDGAKQFSIKQMIIQPAVRLAPLITRYAACRCQR